MQGNWFRQTQPHLVEAQWFHQTPAWTTSTYFLTTVMELIERSLCCCSNFLFQNALRFKYSQKCLQSPKKKKKICGCNDEGMEGLGNPISGMRGRRERGYYWMETVHQFHNLSRLQINAARATTSPTESLMPVYCIVAAVRLHPRLECPDEHVHIPSGPP